MSAWRLGGRIDSRTTTLRRAQKGGRTGTVEKGNVIVVKANMDAAPASERRLNWKGQVGICNCREGQI